MIDVIWHNAQRGSWDHGLLCETFEKYPDIFIQHNTKEPPAVERAIVIVVGCPDIEPLRKYLDTLKSGVVILTSEEDGFFNWKSAIPSHLEVWTQYLTQSKLEIKERILLGVPNRFSKYKIDITQPKKYLWSFVGQVQNQHRQSCVDVLKKLPDGYLQVVEFFGGEGKNGMEYEQYLNIMAQSKFVICPSGSMVCDSFRVYEAMEMGAIPITEKRCPRDPHNFNYWQEVYLSHTMLTLDNWHELTTHYNPSLIKGVAPAADIQNKWWFNYKKELEKKFLNVAHS